MMKIRAMTALALVACWMPAMADAGQERNTTIMVAAGAAGELAEGEVRKIDKAAGKITLRHGQIRNLDMPPMTMVFRVKDPAMLDKLKPGDKINFSADKINGAYTVTGFEPAK